eukprot:jgi/Orpsp1_1/1192433/evm.model.d7180000093204.1
MKNLFITILSLIIVSIAYAHTYESLGIDAIQKQEFEKKIAEETVFPVINISTRNNTELILSKDIYTDCVVDLFNVEENFQIEEKSARVKVRGNSSGFYGDPKRIRVNTVPYKLKFDEKINMLGLHQGKKFKTWVLLKTYSEFIRNDVAFKMGKVISEGSFYVSDSIYVKLYVNDKFQGIYVLCEQNEVNKNRVNVQEAEKNYNGTDIGYYYEIDNYFDDADNVGKYFSLDYEQAIVKDIRGEERKLFHSEYSIKSEFNTEEQLYFIGNYTKNVFKILYLAVEKGDYKTLDDDFQLVNATYTTAEETISEVLDINSAVDMYLLYEMVHDFDVGEGSFYFAIDFSEGSVIKKLQMTSPWDFAWAYDGSPRRYWAGAFCEADFAKRAGDRSNPWLIELAKEEWFHELAAKKWEKVSARVLEQINDEENFFLENKEEIVSADKNTEKEIGKMIQWLTNRVKWMNEAFIPGQGVIVPCEKEVCEEVKPETAEVQEENIEDDNENNEVEENDDAVEITEEVNNEDEDSFSDEEEAIEL